MWNVTYEIVTQESAEHGDVDEHGYIAENVSLRDALDLVFQTRTSRVSGIECVEASSSDIYQAEWIDVYNGMEYETGAHETRALHFPENVTGASRKRVARLMGCYGA